ncbi:MAG: ATP-binding domain-containing protein [Sulfuricellaceae bacterium]|nr:ATP-binding domain-containing protein [Sulfuricellaceae bacterium]
MWAQRDAAVSEGRVQVLNTGADYRMQSWLALQELRRLADLDAGWDWSRVAVIAKEWKVLEPVRAGCELLHIPCHFAGHRNNAPPTRRLREVVRFLRLLDERRGELMPLPQLQALVADLRGDEADSPGNRLVMEFLEDFGSAVGEGAQPIAVMLDAAYEFLAEADRRSGDGMCLTTAHGAKGLEFDHVVVLDGGWRTNGPEALAERRLYYVAMTRARQTLALCRMKGKSFADELASLPAVLARSPVLMGQLPAGLSRRFELLVLREVDIGFTGRSRDATVRRAIAELKIGDELVIDPLSEKQCWAIRTMAGQMVGRTAKFYAPPAGRTVTARVAAICVWRLQDVKTEWQSRMALAEWEVVLPELVVELEG